MINSSIQKNKNVEQQKVCILGNYNVQYQAASLKSIFEKIELLVDVIVTKSEDVIYDLFHPNSLLHVEKNIIAVVVFITTFFINQNEQDYFNNLQETVNVAKNKLNLPVHLVFMPAEHNEKINFSLFENAIVISFLSKNILYDEELYKIVKNPYCHEIEKSTALAVVKHILKNNDCGYKVIAVDADNTLWMGVCGERYKNEIYLVEKNRILCNLLREFKKTGAVICIVSKNNQADVFQALSYFSDNSFKTGEIADYEIHWESKSDSLLNLSKRLNIALKDFLFIDDSREECFQIRYRHPEVTTLCFSDDNAIEELNILLNYNRSVPNSNNNDFDRTKFYQKNRKREVSEKNFLSYQEYLNSLELNIELLSYSELYNARIIELSYRTTQFNCSNQKLSDAILMKYQDENYSAFIVTVSDKFCDYGVVGFLALSESKHFFCIDHFYLSCRSLNKFIEYDILEKLMKKLFVSEVKVVFNKGNRNIPACDFLSNVSNGMTYKESEIIFNVTLNKLKEKRILLSQTLLKQKNIQKKTIYRLFEKKQIVKLHLLDVQEASICANNMTEFNFDLESRVFRIWAELFKNSDIDVHASIDQLGADSLMMARIVATINSEFSINLGIRHIFKYNTCMMLCDCIRECINKKAKGDL